jgi:hypothetical protein
MVGVFGALQRVERGGMLALPLQPARQARDRFVLARPAALDTERIPRRLALGVRQPLAVAARKSLDIRHRRSSAVSSSSVRGFQTAQADRREHRSSRLSSIASSISCAVSEASSTPFR